VEPHVALTNVFTPNSSNFNIAGDTGTGCEAAYHMTYCTECLHIRTARAGFLAAVVACLCVVTLGWFCYLQRVYDD